MGFPGHRRASGGRWASEGRPPTLPERMAHAAQVMIGRLAEEIGKPVDLRPLEHFGDPQQIGAAHRRARKAARTSFSGGWRRTGWNRVWNRSVRLATSRLVVPRNAWPGFIRSR
jgi:hypothetical protein